MSQMNTQGVNVVNTAGDPSQNIATTGQNQRAKAEMKMKELQLKMELEGLKMQKYGIDSQAASYDRLNQSNTDMQTQRIGADQQQQTAQMGNQQQIQQAAQQHDMDMQSKQNDFLIKQDEKTQQRLLQAQHDETQELIAAMAAGKALKADRKSKAAAVAENATTLELAKSIVGKNPEELKQIHQKLEELKNVQLGRVASSSKKGEDAFELGRTDLAVRLTTDIDKILGTRSMGPVQTIARGTFGLNMGDVKKDKWGASEEILKILTGSGQLSNVPNPTAQQAITNYYTEVVRLSKITSPGPNGEPGIDNQEQRERVKQAWNAMTTITDEKGQPVVDAMAIRNMNMRLKVYAEDRASKLKLAGAQVDAGKTLGDEVFGMDKENPNYRTAAGNEGWRETFKGALDVIQHVDALTEASVGAINYSSMDSFASVIDKVQKYIGTMTPLEEIKSEFAKDGISPTEASMLKELEEANYGKKQSEFTQAKKDVTEKGVKAAQYQGEAADMDNDIMDEMLGAKLKAHEGNLKKRATK